MIDSLQISNIYVEKSTQQSIKISSSSNENGVLEIDENGNDLSLKYAGRQVVTGYSGAGLGNVLVYDSTQYAILNSNTNYYLFKDTTYYKINAGEQSFELEYVLNGSNYEFTLDILNSTLFKVYLNGKEITNYSYTDGILSIPTSSVIFINHFDDNCIKVIFYSNNQTISGLGYIYYNGFDSMLNREFLEDLDLIEEIGYGEGNYGEGCYNPTLNNLYKINTIEGDLAYNITETLISYRDSTSYCKYYKKTDKEGIIDLNLFEERDKSDLLYFLDSSKFRIIIHNPYEDILRILTNCQIVEAPTSTIASKNTRKFRVYFESEIYVRTDEILNGVDIV